MNVWIFVLLCAIGLTNGACPDGWVHHGASCYRLRWDTETWIDAKAICEMDGGYLAEIGDKGENEFIHGLITDGGNIWLGGSDLSTETEWKWMSSHEGLSYTNWKVNEPNNAGHDENCMEMQATGVWNDRPCHYFEKYVCEISFEDHQVINAVNMGLVLFADDLYFELNYNDDSACVPRK